MEIQYRTESSEGHCTCRWRQFTNHMYNGTDFPHWISTSVTRCRCCNPSHYKSYLLIPWPIKKRDASVGAFVCLGLKQDQQCAAPNGPAKQISTHPLFYVSHARVLGAGTADRTCHENFAALVLEALPLLHWVRGWRDIAAFLSTRNISKYA